MGFRPKRAPFKLDFTGTEYEGLEVSARPVPMSVMLDVLGSTASGDLSAARHVAATLAYALESWNVEDDDGQPVAADLDGLMSQDARFYDAVLKAWVAAMAGGAT
jgi:hypothetical protein